MNYYIQSIGSLSSKRVGLEGDDLVDMLRAIIDLINSGEHSTLHLMEYAWDRRKYVDIGLVLYNKGEGIDLCLGGGGMLERYSIEDGMEILNRVNGD